MASITDLINEFKEDIDKREKEKKSPKAKYSTDIETYLGSIPSDVRYGWVQPIVDYTILNLGREPTKEELASYTQQYYKSKEGESLFSALKAGRPDTMKSAGLPTQSSEYSPEGLSALIGESERLGEGVGYNAGDKGILEQFKTGAPKTLRGTMKDIRSSPEATYNRASKPSMGRDGIDAKANGERICQARKHCRIRK